MARQVLSRHGKKIHHDVPEGLGVFPVP